MKRFPSLDACRAIACFAVMFHHFEQVYAKLTGEAYFIDRFECFSHLGRLGVVFFFVLSGFLITTIVAKTDDFTYLRFQGRRGLRILPVYFSGLAFTLLSGFFVGNAFTDHNFWEERLLLYLFFLPNLAFNMFSAGGFPIQLWSVGSEIQFYLLWPVLITLFRKTLLRAFIFVISCVSFLKLALHLVIISGFSLEVVKGQRPLNC